MIIDFTVLKFFGGIFLVARPEFSRKKNKQTKKTNKKNKQTKNKTKQKKKKQQQKNKQTNISKHCDRNPDKPGPIRRLVWDQP